jgi:hypothetical protein
MGSSFMVYVDESGDDGFAWNRGGSAWFTLSAVVTRKSNDLEVVKLVDSVNMALARKIGTPLHFRKLRHEHKLPLIDTIARSRLRAVSVLVHKPSISAALKFRGKRHSLYFYAARYLLERVSWLCRDHRRPTEGDGRAEIIFSNRSEMKYEEFRDYLGVFAAMRSKRTSGSTGRSSTANRCQLNSMQSVWGCRLSTPSPADFSGRSSRSTASSRIATPGC